MGEIQRRIGFAVVTTDPRWGLTLPFAGLPLRDHAPYFRLAEELGYDDLWTGDTAGPDGFTPLVLAAAHTERIRLATGIVNPYTRGPRGARPARRGARRRVGGRFVLGLGASSNVIVERWNGIPFEKPLTKMRETLEFLRPVLAGERGAGGFKLESPPAEPVPIVLAALRGKMLELAASQARRRVHELPAAERPAADRRGRARGRGERGPRRGQRRARLPLLLRARQRRGGARDARSSCSPPTRPSPSTPSSSAGSAGASSSTRWSRPGRRATARRALELAPEDLVRDVFIFGSYEEQRARLREFTGRRHHDRDPDADVRARPARGDDQRARAAMSTHGGAVLVTGASTGIGEATAERLAARGVPVLAGARKQSDLERARPDPRRRAARARRHRRRRDRARCASGSRRTRCAGSSTTRASRSPGRSRRLPLDDLRRQFEVNTVGQIAVTQAALPALRLGRGRIVNIGSIGGRVGQPFAGAYCGSKGAIHLMSSSLRRELRPWGIWVTCIEPGTIATEIWDKGDEADRAAHRGDVAGRARALRRARWSSMAAVVRRQAGQRPSAGGRRAADRARAVLAAAAARSRRSGATRALCGCSTRCCRCASGIASSTAGSGCDRASARTASCSRRPAVRAALASEDAPALNPPAPQTRRTSRCSRPSATTARFAGSPYPPIADYAFLSDCEVKRARRAQRERRVDVHPAHGRAVDLRRVARSRRGLRSRSRRWASACRSAAATCRDDDPRDDLGDAHGLGRRARPAADRPLAPRRRPLDAHTGARRPTATPTTCCCG